MRLIFTLDGVEDDEETRDDDDLLDGGDGDTLDLRGLGEVDVVYNEDDPTFDPETGVSESGTATYTNDAGDPVTINFSEIEDVLADVIDQSPVANDDTADATEDK